jgi:excisionase family DNA binding protein
MDRSAALAEELPDEDFVREFQLEATRLARRLESPFVNVDIAFLAYLLRTSRFGFFNFGPITLDTRLIEEIVERTTQRAEPRGVHTYSDDYVRFSRCLGEEVRRSGRRRIDELHLLLAFMRTEEGLPARVFGELGVTADQVEEFARNSQGRPASSEPEKLYSPEEAAEYLGVHVQTVRGWIRSGRLKASRLAGQRALRIRASALQSVLEPIEPADLNNDT